MNQDELKEASANSVSTVYAACAGLYMGLRHLEDDRKAEEVYRAAVTALHAALDLTHDAMAARHQLRPLGRGPIKSHVPS